MIKSTDGRETWGDIKRINNDNSGRHQFFPWMSVDPTTGYIYIVFYDRRDTTHISLSAYKDKQGWKLYLAGSSWTRVVETTKMAIALYEDNIPFTLVQA